jgi:hypothetical protein
MTSPYTTQPLDAYMAAQSSVGLVLGAIVWFRRWRPWPATLLVLFAIALAITAPALGEFLVGVGAVLPLHYLPWALKTAAALAALGAVMTRLPSVAIAGVLGEALLWKVTDYIQDSDIEIAALHVGFFGLLVGLHVRATLRREGVASLAVAPPLPSSTAAAAWAGTGTAAGNGAAAAAAVARETRRGLWRDDVFAFVLGTAAGAVVCRGLLHGFTNSGDEWANTFQAAVFAKLRAFAAVPRCSESFRSFWVFQYLGRSFSQYTPGWPLFMAPFVLVRAVWLAGPASLGLLSAAGVAPGREPPPAGLVRAAGWLAVVALLPGASLLINGGSRYPHVFVAAMFAWAVEAVMALERPGAGPGPSRGGRARSWAWGATLGVSAGLLLAARPGDGAALGIGIFLYFVIALARGRVGWRALTASTATFGVIVGLTLVILRLQVGRWWVTGYSLTPVIYPWVDFKWSIPAPNEYKWAIPLASWAYCWWPCSVGVGLAGMALFQGRARGMAVVFVASYVPFFALYSLLSMARGFDLGYGPRYTLPSVVPMAVGSGVVLAHLWAGARQRWTSASALRTGGPAAVALTAIFLGVLRVAPYLYPITYADVQAHNRLAEALRAQPLKNAVVFGGPGFNNTDPADLTENLPLELYRNQDVLIAVDRGPEALRCVRELYPQRSFYRAVPGPHVQLLPF